MTLIVLEAVIGVNDTHLYWRLLLAVTTDRLLEVNMSPASIVG